MTIQRDLWHYTCLHAGPRIEKAGIVLPVALLTQSVVNPLGQLAWFTDLDAPFRLPLGLTSHSLPCDRTEYRFKVLTDEGIIPWRDHPLWATPLGQVLMKAPGVMPRHWYVSEGPVPVERVP